MSEEIDRHVLRRFEICQKLGKGVSSVREQQRRNRGLNGLRRQETGEIVRVSPCRRPKLEHGVFMSVYVECDVIDGRPKLFSMYVPRRHMALSGRPSRSGLVRS